ncbi:MAG: M48 family metalloprotease [Elusimicrobiota bacterium]
MKVPFSTPGGQGRSAASGGVRRARLAALCAAAAVLAAACFRNPVTHRREAKLISEATERRIGAETKEDLVREYGELKDPVLREYVSAVGDRLAAASDRPRLDFEFTILDTEMVNAFAAPGGYIFVTRGLLEELSGEAELASVLGHEIGHVCAWHSINMIEKQMGYGTLATLGAIVSGFQLGPEAMIMVAQTADLFTGLYLLGYSREYELEADRVGLRYALSAGYRAEAMLTFFQRLAALEKQEGLDKWESFFRSHPPTADRIQLARRYLGRMDAAGRPAAPPTGSYADMKRRLPSVPESQKGRAEGLVYENDAWNLRFHIPGGWTWEPGARQTLAGFREKDGPAWGELRRLPLKPGEDAAALAEKWAASRQWQVLQAKEALYPAGYGVLGQFYGPGRLGGAYQYRAFFTVSDGAGYVLFCAAPPEHMNKYLIPCEQTLRSFSLD